MKLPAAACVVFASLLAGGGSVPAAFAAPARARGAARALLEAYPGVLARREGPGGIAFFGAPMTAGRTPARAAAAWLAEHAGALGVEAADLEPERANEVGRGAFTVFAYRQVMEGLPVEGGRARILVRNDVEARVVYAAGRLAGRPKGGLAPVAIPGAEAVRRMRATESFRTLQEWSEPEPVVFFAEDTTILEAPARAWRFSAADLEAEPVERYTFFVDASSGRLLHVRDAILRGEVTGHVHGNATPGLRPDVEDNPPVDTALGDVLVGIDGGGGGSAYSDASGDFVIPHDGSDPVLVGADLVGEWVHVLDASGPELHAEQLVTPPGPADLLFNDTPSEYTTAQMNAFLQTTATHDFYKSRQPGFTGLDLSLLAHVNKGGVCNAFFDPFEMSINFLRAGDPCPNSAYTTIIAHEYGHFIVHKHDITQGAFGEGYSDSVAILEYDDPVVGREFGPYFRDIVQANKQYPCEGEIHDCGQVLAGCWWDTKLALQATLGEEEGRELARQLFTDWTEITLGGWGQDSAHPGTLVEVLTVDDDDGYLANGTPHFDEICEGFGAHNIPCDPLPPVLFFHPGGLHPRLSPDHETTLRIRVEAYTDRPVPGTATITYRFDGGPFETHSMDEEGGGDRYRYVFPRTSCPRKVDFYYGIDSEESGVVTDPPDAPPAVHRSVSAAGFVPLFEDDFEEDRGWHVTSENLTSGEWERGVPQGNIFLGEPVADYDGSGQCYLTGNGGGGNTDVDGGPTRLTSPQMNFATGDGLIRYAFWMYCSEGDDSLTLEIRRSGMAPWVRVRRYHGGAGGWVEDAFVVSDYVQLSNQIQVRFSISDNPDDSVTEAAIDAFRAEQFDCVMQTGFRLSMTPLVRGADVELRAEGCVPGTKVVFLRSRHGLGDGACSPGLGGLCIDLLGPVVRTGVSYAGADGVATLSVRCPAGAPLIPYGVQAVNRAGPGGSDSTKSNVVTETVRDAP